MSIVDRFLGRPEAQRPLKRGENILKESEALSSLGAIWVGISGSQWVYGDQGRVELEDPSGEKAEFAFHALNWGPKADEDRTVYPSKGLRLRAKDGGKIEVDLRVDKDFVPIDGYLAENPDAMVRWEDFCRKSKVNTELAPWSEKLNFGQLEVLSAEEQAKAGMIVRFR